MAVVLDFLKEKLVNVKIPKPIGELSGHNSGEPFAEYVFDKLKNKYTSHILKQYEYLNNLYTDNPNCSDNERLELIKSKTASYLLRRGKDVTKKWNINNQFTYKQNDTADMLYVDENIFNIIDVKTTNIEKDGQPPNIISATKVAEMCKLMIENDEYDDIDINYIGIYWSLEDDMLVSKSVEIKNLFKSDPKDLYINWAAAMQIQFHIHKLSQNFTLGKKEWCKSYLNHFIGSVENRKNTMTKKFIDPYKKFLE